MDLDDDDEVRIALLQARGGKSTRLQITVNGFPVATITTGRNQPMDADDIKKLVRRAKTS